MAALAAALPVVLSAQTVPTGWATAARIARVDVAASPAPLPAWVAESVPGSEAGLEDVLRRAMRQLGANMAGPLALRMTIAAEPGPGDTLAVRYALSDPAGTPLARSEARPLPRPGGTLGSATAQLTDRVARDAGDWITGLGCLPDNCAVAPESASAPAAAPDDSGPTLVARLFGFLEQEVPPAEAGPPAEDDTPTAQAPRVTAPPAHATRPGATADARAAIQPPAPSPAAAMSPAATATPSGTGSPAATASSAAATSPTSATSPTVAAAPAAAGSPAAAATATSAPPPVETPRPELTGLVADILRAEQDARAEIASSAESAASTAQVAPPRAAAPMAVAAATPARERVPAAAAPVAAAPAAPLPRVPGRWIGSTPAEVAPGGKAGTWVRTPMVETETAGWAMVEATGATAQITLLPAEMRLDQAASLSTAAADALKVPAGSAAALSLYVAR
ncbi:hypothetical protein FDP22_02640 [Paroceanicella profunda]|uniref:Uncharacterized protein n=1 Tax=Paroceanicella profunda TaxID=2579971 RepID=A0A5B8FWK8_9RHOB|nr:hypothetical protein [Paroceanicella profunda]QDL90782.1 hypothetical protein FDP22_02640 [Paroceanicella profunda]